LFGRKDNPYGFDTLLITLLLDVNNWYTCHNRKINASVVGPLVSFNPRHLLCLMTPVLADVSIFRLSWSKFHARERSHTFSFCYSILYLYVFLDCASDMELFASNLDFTRYSSGSFYTTIWLFVFYSYRVRFYVPLYSGGF